MQKNSIPENAFENVIHKIFCLHLFVFSYILIDCMIPSGH